MRVVSGTARGRKLQAPPGSGTRPTSDRVREAVFDMLTSMDVVEGATVLDLFAGSGALGIECISRGAESAVLVDHHAAAVATIRRNLDVLGEAAARATVVRSDALTYAASAPAFDLVLADPPYGFDRWAELLESLLPRAGLLVVETGAEPGPSLWAPGPAWETVKVKRYGGTVVCIVKPVGRT
ncbi:MAG TPA: 16S rRNA (guanine(966)-N(2))-methyltransferase RsmD [Acidimicrobiales bacterium]|nr:16S rRNA (guanine(966)-N(2))-methyltransferase RsmD [Acidimicrobiales bacterium]